MNTRWLGLLALSGLLAAGTGCAAMVRYESPSLSDQRVTSSHTQRSLGFLWGLIPPSHISLEQCGPQGIHHMKVRQGPIDSLITYGTMGVVISYKVKIYCSGSAPTDAEPAAP